MTEEAYNWAIPMIPLSDFSMKSMMYCISGLIGMVSLIWISAFSRLVPDW